MTQAPPDGLLMKLSDTALTLADPREDIRDRRVIDRQGDEIGHVSALFVDLHGRRVRMVQVGAGGFLGLGERHFLVPVEAVTRVTPDEVHINQVRERVVNSPRYDPDLTVQSGQDFWAPYYGYSGIAPFWGAGYPPPLY